ncbi:helicase HerA-like domain-containing protein [Sphingomonas sp. MMS24-JH45]
MLCFFFDKAHLLFDDAPDALAQKIEQVVRLIRSKGVGVYFITQNPIDIPDKVAGRLGNRVQHKLNAFTPRDQKAVAAAADTFRPNPAVDVGRAITELKVGEALVSLLQPDGAPSPVERTLIRPPASRVGPLTPAERRVMIESDAVGAKYDTVVDREFGGGIARRQDRRGSSHRRRRAREGRRRQGRGTQGPTTRERRRTPNGRGSRRSAIRIAPSARTIGHDARQSARRRTPRGTRR